MRTAWHWALGRSQSCDPVPGSLGAAETHTGTEARKPSPEPVQHTPARKGDELPVARAKAGITERFVYRMGDRPLGVGVGGGNRWPLKSLPALIVSIDSTGLPNGRLQHFDHGPGQ